MHLFTPGPTPLPEQVRDTLALPIIPHRSDMFEEIFHAHTSNLKQLFRTQHDVITLCASGTTAYESAITSLLQPADHVLSLQQGKFSERWHDMLTLHAANSDGLGIHTATLPWGQAFTAEKLNAILSELPTLNLITLMHCETSTGTTNPIETLVPLLRAHSPKALVVVDAITSVGALPFHMDAWDIDVAITASQKALMLPPGLGFVAVGPRAKACLEQPLLGHAYSMDLRRYLINPMPFTPSISLIRAQKVACDIILANGLEATWQATQARAENTRDFLQQHTDTTLASDMPSNSLTAFKVPEHIKPKTIQAQLIDTHDIYLAGGQKGRLGDWRGDTLRINHMGQVTQNDTLFVLEKLSKALA